MAVNCFVTPYSARNMLLLLCIATTIGSLWLSVRDLEKRCSMYSTQVLVDEVVSYVAIDRDNDELLSVTKSSSRTQAKQHPRRPTPPMPSTYPVAMDIISIGSNTRPSTIQQETFARHLAVRNYWRFTEDDDHSDPLCHVQLSRDDMSAIASKCHANQTTYSGPARVLAKHFASQQFLRRHPPGWLCAQKRPIDALARVVMTQYSHSQQDRQRQLPDYLWIIDDDSWLHLDNILTELPTQHTPDTARVVAGCLIRSQFDLHLSWYWGGFGVVLTRGAIARLMLPIQSQESTRNDAFMQHACWQLEQNWIGEREFFRPGMSLVQLMQAYSAQQSYLQHDKWKFGYCMHSDTTLAYWFNFYHVADAPTSLTDGDSSRPQWMALPGERNNAVHENRQLFSSHQVPPSLLQIPQYDRLRAYNDTALHKTRKWQGKIYRSAGECRHKTLKNCTLEAHICHYIPDDHMRKMFVVMYQEHTENYLSDAKPLSKLS